MENEFSLKYMREREYSEALFFTIQKKIKTL